MLKSKLLSTGNPLLLAIVLGTSLGCDLPKAKQSYLDYSNSEGSRITKTFLLDKVSGESEVVSLDEQTGLANRKEFKFVACLKDRKKKSGVQRNDFEIQNQQFSIKPKLDAAGCLHWSETFSFNPLENSKNLTLKRTIVGLGYHQGSISMNIAINPWAYGDREEAVTDLFYITPQSLVDVQTSNSYLTTSAELPPQAGTRLPLIINDARVTIQELALHSQTGGLFKIDFRLTPQVELKSTIGQALYRELKQGDFDIEIQLLNSSLEGSQLKTTRLNKTDLKANIKMQNGLLAGNLDFQIPLVPTRGRLEMALFVSAKNGSSRLRNFQGIFLLGEFNDIKGSFWGRLKAGQSNNSPNFDMASYLNLGTTSTTTNPSDLAEGYRKLKYEFDPMSFKFTRIGSESNLNRRVHFQAKACIRNGADGSAVRDFQITISKMNGEISTRKTEYDSCVYWDDSLEHSYYSQQMFKSYKVKLSNETIGLTETLEALINPWDIADSRDVRTIEKTELEAQRTAGKAPATITLDSFKYTTLAMNYELDRFFALTFKKKVNLVLEPDVIIYGQLDKGLSQKENLREGIYLLRTVLQRNNYESPEDRLRFLSANTQLVTLSQGRISTNLELELRDYRLMGSRNNLLIKLDPIDTSKISIRADGSIDTLGQELTHLIINSQDSGLQSPTFIAPIIVANDEEGKLVQTVTTGVANLAVLGQGTQAKKLLSQGLDIEEISTKGIKEYQDVQMNLAKLATPESFARENNLMLLNVDSETPTLELRKGLGDIAYYVNTRPEYKKYSRREKPSSPLVELQNLVQTGKMSATLEQQFCGYWFNDLMRRMAPNKYDQFLGTQPVFLYYECLGKMRKKQSFFSVEQRLHSGQLSQVEFRNGTSLAINVGSSFSVSRSSSETFTKSMSLSANAGLSFKFFDIFSLGGTATYSISKAYAEAQARSNSSNVGMGTNLTARRVLLDFNLSNAKPCVTVRLSPEVISGPKAILPKLLHPQLNEEQKVEILTKGFLFCSSQAQASKKLTETYYFVTQEMGTSGAIDTSDLRNRPLVVAFRGENSLNQFLSMAGSQLKTAQQAVRGELNEETPQLLLNPAIIHKTPSYPGFYVLPQK